ADFTFEINGLSVLFTDTSTGAPTTRQWDFGDGTNSAEINPRHNYAVAGSYTVVLTVSNSAGPSNKSKFVAVTTRAPLLASFNFEINGRSVLFTDPSTGSPTAWAWDFGDTGVSTSKNPSHTYGAAGAYTVALTITNAFGTTARASRFVTLPGPPKADFAFTTS